jgi:hypothetical protein
MDDIIYAPLKQWQRQRHQMIVFSERLLVLLEALDMPVLQSEVWQMHQDLNADKLQVMAVGKGNRGKSTVINALLGQKVLPAYPVPTTALLSEVTWGEQPKAFLHYHLFRSRSVMSPQAIPFSELEHYLVIDADEGHAEEYERVELRYPLPLCSLGVQLIDSPALDEDERYLVSTMKRLQSVDAVLFILACDGLPSREESLDIEKIKCSGQMEIFFLCNRFDLVEPSAQERVKLRWLNYLRQFTGYSEQSTFFTNAKGALTGRLEDNREKLENSNLLLVEEALYAFLAKRGEERLLSVDTALKAVVNKVMYICETQREVAGATPRWLLALEDELRTIKDELEVVREDKG